MTPILIHVRPLDPTTGLRVDIRLGSGPPAFMGLGGFVWEPAITRRPVTTFELMHPTLGRGVLAGRSGFSVNLTKIRSVASPGTLVWSGAPVTIYDATSFNANALAIDFKGVIRSPALDVFTRQLALDCAVDVSRLARPLLTGEFTGGGGLNGDAGKKGTLLPAGFGVVRNVEPVWFDETSNIGMLDGYGNLTAVSELFESGVSFGAAYADYPTYTALKTALDNGTVPNGRWATSIAWGLIGLGAPPDGVITCHATFTAQNANQRKPGTLLYVLMYRAGLTDADLDVASFTALDVSVPRNVNYHAAQQRSIQDLAEAVAGSCNASLVILPSGQISVVRAVGGAIAGTLSREVASLAKVTDWKQAGNIDPVWRLRALAARPGRVMSYEDIRYEDDLTPRGVWSATETYRQGHYVDQPNGSRFLYINAAATAGNALPVAPATATAYWQRILAPSTAADLVYADGTPIENLKPQESGANKTETRTAAAIANMGTGALANNLTQMNPAEGAKLGGVADGAGTTVDLVESSADLQVTGNSAKAITAGLHTAYDRDPLLGAAQISATVTAGAFDNVGSYAVVGICTAAQRAVNAADATGFKYALQLTLNMLAIGPWGVVALGTSPVVGARYVVIDNGETVDFIQISAAGAITYLYSGASTTTKLEALYGKIGIAGTSVQLADIRPQAVAMLNFGNLGGADKPAPRATADMTFSSIGSQLVKVSGNTAIRAAGGNDYNACVMGEPFYRGIIASVDINTAAGVWTMLNVDDDAVGTNYATMRLAVQYQYSSGTFIIWKIDGTVALNTNIGQVTGKLSIAYDSIRYRVTTGPTQRGGDIPEVAGLTLWPKWHAYTANVTYTGMKATPYTDNDWATLGGIDKPEDKADVSIVLVAPPGRTFNASSDSTYPAGTFPAYLQLPKVTRLGVDERTLDTTTYAITPSASITATVDNANGSATKGLITITGVTASGHIDLTVTVRGKVQPTERITLSREVAPPPVTQTGGSGGGTNNKAADISLGGTGPANTTYVAITGNTRVTKGTGETLRVTVNAEYLISSGVTASAALNIRVQYAVAGSGSWTDMTLPSTATVATGSLSYWYAADYSGEGGALSTVTFSAAPVNGDYDIRVLAGSTTSRGIAIQSGLASIRVGA